MKTKNRLFSQKKVYYFSYKNGILQKGVNLPVLRVFATSFMAVAVLFVAGYNIHSFYVGQRSGKSFQQAVAEPEVSQAETAKDKLRTATTQAEEDKVLASVISEKLTSLPKGQQWSVYVRDLNTNRMASVAADESYDPASFYQLFLLPALENKVSADLWNGWRTRINNKPVSHCVDLMIRASDGVCGEAVGNFVGWDYADQVNQSLGFHKTKLSPDAARQTTAREVGDLMYRLQTSQLLSDKARRNLFDALYAQAHTDGIPAGCGVNCLVANKTGQNDTMHHDVAVVTDGEAKYIVVIMSKGASWQTLAEVERAVNTAMLP